MYAEEAAGMPEISRGSAGKAVKVFCSYAHNDERWREKLVRHLSQLTRDGLLDVWHDRKIRAGANWPRAIDEHLDSAGLIFLLISPDLRAWQYCCGMERRRALERHEAGQAVIIPILLRPCDWQTAPFAQLQALPAGKFISEWSERDEDAAFASVARGIRELLTALADPAVVSLSGGQNGAWNVPFTRNPFFTAREEQLAQIHVQLRSGQSVAIGQVQAISGLGGIGKTQLAVEYAYRHRQEYRAVLWVRADTLETLNGSYSDIAARLNLPEKDAREQALVVQAVKTWLETHPGWLLILDNLDEPRVLFPLDDHDQ